MLFIKNRGTAYTLPSTHANLEKLFRDLILPMARDNARETEGMTAQDAYEENEKFSSVVESTAQGIIDSSMTSPRECRDYDLEKPISDKDRDTLLAMCAKEFSWMRKPDARAKEEKKRGKQRERSPARVLGAAVRELGRLVKRSRA